MISERREIEFLTFHSYEKFEVSLGVMAVLDAVREANRLFTAGAPWKSPDRDRVDALVYLALETARVAALLLQPVIPEAAGNLLARLGVDATNVRAAAAREPTAMAGTKVTHAGPVIFPKVVVKPS